MSNHQITFARIQAYLDAIADQALLDIGNSPHKRFWNVSYQEFIGGVVPGGTKVECDGQAPPLINKQKPLETPFYLILLGKWCKIDQMPDGGPFITEPNFTVTLKDGTQVKGKQIQDDIASWLSNGFPET